MFLQPAVVQFLGQVVTCPSFSNLLAIAFSGKRRDLRDKDQRGLELLNAVSRYELAAQEGTVDTFEVPIIGECV